MPSNNSKYTQEIRDKTAKFILDTGKSATSVAEEMGIDTNTVCKWVRDYRRKHKDNGCLLFYSKSIYQQSIINKLLCQRMEQSSCYTTK